MDKILKKTYWSPHMYREDIEAIENLISEELKPRTYEIKFGEYKYGSIKEISEETVAVSDFSITTHSPHLDINLNKYQCQIQTFDGDIRVAGVLARVDQIIEERDRILFPILSRVSTWILFISLFLLFSFSSILKDKDLSLLLVEYTTLRIGLVAIVISLILTFFPYRPKIEFVYKNRTPNFLSRNKDQIALAMVSALIGVIATFILTRFLG